ncbi:uncharacterized protein LOC131855702 [Achroia grisella]|uniref:uncharacterized protein LOC131855702 n=1 Tax=Achroia grisella TaxID=688607 RepID=UPI0027D310E3|nr:uncharacterized protein LOC131855702 [Achroia grisella]
MASRKKKLPQGGTGRSAAGQSSSTAPDMPGVDCPTFSGGDNDSQSRVREGSRRYESALGTPITEDEITGSQSEGSITLVMSTSPKRVHRKRRVVERPVHPESEDDVDLVEVSSAGTRRKTSKELVLRADELGATIEESALQVLAAIKKSGNLKGTIVREVKGAVEAIRSASEVLKTRSANIEMATIAEENSRLRDELEELLYEKNRAAAECMAEKTELMDLRVRVSSTYSIIEELAQLKAEREELRREAQESRRLLEDLKKSNALDRKAMHAAMAKLEEAKNAAEFPPVVITSGTSVVASVDAPPRTINEDAEDRIIRRVGEMMESRFAEMEDPISANRRRPPKAAKSAPTAGSSGTVPGDGQYSREPIGKSVPQPSTSKTNKEGWSTVVRRGKGKGAGTGQAGPAKVQPKKGPRGGQTEEPQRKPSERKKRVKARPPRLTAVVLTMRPGAEDRGVTYASLLTEAKYFFGRARREVADALAARIEEVLPEDAVRVSRPVKSAELRIGDLDDTVLVADVVVAVMRDGGCLESSVKTGEIRRNSQGTGSIWVRCPVTAARKLVEAGRLRVGWVMARVQSLDPRPQRCYRCLLTGHVGVRCTAVEDSSGICFRCCEPGHKAARCAAPSPKCRYCAAAGRKSDHRVGVTKECRPPKARAPAPTSGGGGEGMDT